MLAKTSLKLPLGVLVGISVGLGQPQLLRAHHDATHSASQKPTFSPSPKVAPLNSPAVTPKPQTLVEDALPLSQTLLFIVGGGAILSLGSLWGYQTIARRRPV